MTTEIKERIVKYSKELRLPTFRGEFEVHASEAAKQEASYEEYLLGLMEKEYYTRVENRKKSQIRQAGFPQKHYLHDLQKELLPDNARQKLPLLERLDFIKEGRNVVLAGNPGTGKTHIATGLGIKACQHNYKVLFSRNGQTTWPLCFFFCKFFARVADLLKLFLLLLGPALQRFQLQLKLVGVHPLKPFTLTTK
jgi:DNA replication protein DnaC